MRANVPSGKGITVVTARAFFPSSTNVRGLGVTEAAADTPPTPSTAVVVVCNGQQRGQILLEMMVISAPVSNSACIFICSFPFMMVIFEQDDHAFVVLGM